MSKPIKIWNLRDASTRGHYFVCATTKKAAATMITEFENPTIVGREDFPLLVNRTIRDMTVYSSEGCWGRQMDGITPEPGLWHTRDNREKPVKVL